MILRKNIIKFWALFVVVLALALAAITMAHRWHRIFPSDEVSEIYTRYADCTDIKVSYVKNYSVNDTTRVNVTLVETTDSAAWDRICDELSLTPLSKIPEEFRELYFSSQTFESIMVKDTVPEGSVDRHLRTLYVYSRYYKTVCVFHSIDEAQYDAIIDKELDGFSF